MSLWYIERNGKPFGVEGGFHHLVDEARILTRHTHGTGCTLSSAIATHMGLGAPLEEAVEKARAFVRAAINSAPGYGGGSGPLGHQAVR